MRILYGVQGTGNGHLARARPIARALAARGVDVNWLFSGRVREGFSGMDAFGDWAWRRGLTFVHRDGAVDALGTWRANRWESITREVRELDLTGFDLVVSDFEPVTAWAARRAGVRSVGISNQAAYAYPIPRVGSDPVQSAVFRWFAPVDVPVGMHWDPLGLPLVPPVVETPAPGPVDDDLVLVYLPFERLEHVVEVLAQVRGARFLCYHPAAPAGVVRLAAGDAGHVRVQGLCGSAFPRDLARCGSVLANAGFGLASEAIALGRRILVKPMDGQFEQASNAHVLSVLGMGQSVRTLTPGAVESWLATPRPAPRPWPDAASAIADWLAEGATAPVEALSRAAWAAVPAARSTAA
jgi:uncharacterized protein (TIGR00661 family)